MERYQEITTTGAQSATLTEVNALFEVEYSSASGRTNYRASIMGGTGVVAIRTVRDDGVLTTRYITGNHLGGVSVITDEVGTVDEQVSDVHGCTSAAGGRKPGAAYDAFGERRDPATWQPYATSPDLTNITDKGYTGQQQLDAVGLIHMNGRVYDPVVGRFMSADPTVPDPLDGQSFARYAYVENNPLSAIDPSGFETDHYMWDVVTSSWDCYTGNYNPCSAPGPKLTPTKIAADSGNGTVPSPVPTVETPIPSAPNAPPPPQQQQQQSGSGSQRPCDCTTTITNPGNPNSPFNGWQFYDGYQIGNCGTACGDGFVTGTPDWSTVGPVNLPRGPNLVEIPSPGAPTGGGPTAGAPKVTGSGGVTIGATTDAVPWGTAIASGLDTLLLKAASVIGLALKLSGDTPNQRYFRHYTSDTSPGDFARGLNAGSYATTGYGPVMTPKLAQMSLSLKVTPTVYYDVTIYSGDIPIEGPFRVPANFGQPGGGLEFIFPQGTPAGSITGPFPLPGGG